MKSLLLEGNLLWVLKQCLNRLGFKNGVVAALKNIEDDVEIMLADIMTLAAAMDDG